MKEYRALFALALLQCVPSSLADPGIGTQKLRGVNIGGWLVLEPWITPSIFTNVDQSLAIVDEYTLCQRLPGQAPGILRNHWDTWASLEDFQKIAATGMNMVRIPIGYWAFDNGGSPYVTGAADYLDKAISWARTANLKVIIDLHGAPGSQNGFDNSGQRLDITAITWLQGGISGPTAQQAIGVLTQIAGKYAQASYRDVVIGIELLNEPAGWYLNNADLRAFYQSGYEVVRKVSPDTAVVLQDAFLQPSSYNGFLTPSSNAYNVVLVFTEIDVAMSPSQHISGVCGSVGTFGGADKPVFIGEWTGAFTDCAKYLNGYGRGARYDGTFENTTSYGSCENINNVATWDGEQRNNARMFIEAQMDVFEAHSQGYVWWNFKTENAHEWDMFVLLDAGIFPNPVTDRKNPPACGY